MDTTVHILELTLIIIIANLFLIIINEILSNNLFATT